MNQNHDPLRQADYLRQSLSQEKRPLSLFLSGGCPMAIKVTNGATTEPLIPGIEGITKTVRDRLNTSEVKDPFQTILNHFAHDQRGEPNVEDLLTHVRSLRGVAGRDEIRGVTASDLDTLDHDISKIIVDAVHKILPNSDTPY